MPPHRNRLDVDLVRHAHPVLPDFTAYSISRIQCDVALGLPAGYRQETAPGLQGWASPSVITFFLHSIITDTRRVLRFTDVCCVDDLLADGQSFYIFDVRFLNWEHIGVEVGQYSDTGRVCFYARTVEDVTKEYETICT
jgi:hypothetical protein